uniref:Uncharacterized protein n=1 Tax=Timema douglasi TaxID=61478 RepID=A0A7R8VKR1_TIMDO|nr:unnamed protein product [Timema douglasi]
MYDSTYISAGRWRPNLSKQRGAHFRRRRGAPAIGAQGQHTGARENPVARVNDLNIYSCLNCSCLPGNLAPGKKPITRADILALEVAKEEGISRQENQLLHSSADSHSVMFVLGSPVVSCGGGANFLVYCVLWVRRSTVAIVNFSADVVCCRVECSCVVINNFNGSSLLRTKHLPITGFLEHLRSDLENIIDLLSMDRWLKSGSLKKTIKTSATVPPVAMEASTANSVEEDGAVANARITGQDEGFLDESATAGVTETSELLKELPRSAPKRLRVIVAITAKSDRLNASTQLRETYYAGAALFAHRTQSRVARSKYHCTRITLPIVYVVMARLSVCLVLPGISLSMKLPLHFSAYIRYHSYVKREEECLPANPPPTPTSLPYPKLQPKTFQSTADEGCLPTQMNDFQGTRAQLRWLNLFVIPESYQAMCHVVNECRKVAAMSLFNLSFGKNINLDEFLSVQTQATNSMFSLCSKKRAAHWDFLLPHACLNHFSTQLSTY